VIKLYNAMPIFLLLSIYTTTEVNILGMLKVPKTCTFYR